MSDEKGFPGVSAVVCCHDSAAVIARSISALAAQRVPEGLGYEVVLVDNRCTDDTVARARAAWGNAPFPLRVVAEPEPGLIHARRAGLEAAGYGIVLFVDDDNLPAPDWVEKLPGLFAAHPRVAALGGCNQPLIEGPRPEWFVFPYAGVFASQPQGERSGPLSGQKTLYGAGLALRAEAARRLFREGPPFFLTGRTGDRPLRGEDSEICLRLALSGWDLWYEESLRLQHLIPPQRLSWAFAREARRHGGRADSRLLIYQDLAEGREPAAFHARCRQVGQWWKEFWEMFPSIAALELEGNPMGFRCSYLQGLTEELLALGKDGYMEIRGQLIRHYGNRH